MRQRYEYFGFVQGGLQWRYFISQANVRHALGDTDASGVSFCEILPGGPEEQAAAALHRARRVWRDRDAEGFATVCRTYRGTPLAILEGGVVTGFLVHGDKPEYLWDLCVKDAPAMDRALKAYVTQQTQEGASLVLPDWETTARLHLNRWCESVSCAASEQTRILRYRPVVEALLKLKATYMPLADGEQGFSCEGQTFTVRVKQGEVTVTDGAETPLVLDALEAGRALLFPFPMAGRAELPAGWAPLPVFVCPPDAF